MSRHRKTDRASTPPLLDPNHPDALTAFRARVATGDYSAVFGRGLRRALRDAAQDTSLEPEIGALRLTLMRLLTEESDPSRLAAGVSRIAQVALQAARLRQDTNPELDSIHAHVLRQLDVIEAEYAAAQSAAPSRTWTLEEGLR
ncbi:MAG: hypothetical protein H0V00_17365 [Chloroflexia bacterium]|nr:hypothetical protein [Chloroflexia bacterium]